MYRHLLGTINGRLGSSSHWHGTIVYQQPDRAYRMQINIDGAKGTGDVWLGIHNTRGAGMSIRCATNEHPPPF